jgi:serine/threonine-protein kinase
VSTPPLETLLQTLEEHQLLLPAQLEELRTKLLPRFHDSKSLVQLLRVLGWLTVYQAEQLLKGRGRDLVLGNYILLERLGEGSMAKIFKARRRDRSDLVAIKVLRHEHVSNPQTLRRFQREVWAIAQLSHPNIVRMLEAHEQEESYYFVMEYVEGIDLGWLVQSLGPLAADEACDYIRQAALGLQHAHEHGLVHRDIKPGNLLLTTGGMHIKVLDMGLVRLFQSAGTPFTALTKEGAILGTPDFVAPEQASDAHQVDARADLYSLGCTFYYLLTGRPPFVEGTAPEKLLMHCCVEPEPVEKLCPEVPAEIAAIVRRLMAKAPEDRYPSAAELLAALPAPPIH